VKPFDVSGHAAHLSHVPFQRKPQAALVDSPFEPNGEQTSYRVPSPKAMLFVNPVLFEAYGDGKIKPDWRFQQALAAIPMKFLSN
jgi:hypothetical protein